MRFNPATPRPWFSTALTAALIACTSACLQATHAPDEILRGHGLPPDLACLIEDYARMPKGELDTWPDAGSDHLARRWADINSSVPPLPESALDACASHSSSSESKLAPGEPWRYTLVPGPALLCNGVDNGFPILGYGRTLHLTWAAPPEPGTHEAFAKCTGSGSVLKDSAGRTGLDLAMVEDLEYLALVRLTGRPGAWRASLVNVRPLVRGMLPFAGAPEEAPGFCGGKATAARFTEPHGMARVGRPGPEGFSDRSDRAYAVVSDPGAHALALVDDERGVLQHWGDPGRSGHVDGPREEARFNRPTFVATIWGPGPDTPSRTFLVADSGNDVIRIVLEDDSVKTFAGTGEPGHLDGPAATARFSAPTGLAALDADTCYVADRGNHVIRRIHKGVVTTIAGSPGQAGDRDGSGAEARFRDLQGLACNAATGEIFVLDGNRVRRLAPADTGFQVTRLVGAVAPGFQPRPGDPLSPCLNQPIGLAFRGQALYIADTGNRALRVFDLGTSELWTVAGDPAAPLGVTYGLCRDHLPFLPGQGYAGLDTPRAFLPAFPSKHHQAVLTGKCIAHLPLGWTPAEVRDSDYPTRMETRERDLRLAAATEVRVGTPLALALDLAPREGFARTGAYTYRVECQDALGRPLQRPTGVQNPVLAGVHPFLGSLDLTENFGSVGQVLIQATVTSETGYSWGVEHRLVVTD